MRYACTCSPVVAMLAVMFLLASHASAQEQVVVQTQDGRSITGELISQDASGVTLRIAGIATTFAAEQVKSVDKVKTLTDIYNDKKAQLKADDLDGRYKLAQWLYDQWGSTRDDKALDLADRELADLAKQFPDDTRVSRLRDVVLARLKLRADNASKTPTQPNTPPTNTQQTTGENPAQPYEGDLPTKMLEPEQWNLIKVYEADLSSRSKPAVTVTRETRQQLITQYADQSEQLRGQQNQTKVLAMPGWQVLGLMFDVKARDLYAKATIHDDPPALRQFRVNIHQRYVLSYCATSDCHGGASAGSFFLFRNPPNAEQTVYTNFYILNEFANKDGSMIDRNDKDRSLLLQYGLPAADATTPHPGKDRVPGWLPRFRNKQDPEYQAIGNWIGDLWRPTPDYGIEYPLPTLKTPEPEKPAEPAPATTPPSPDM
ncbi:MAG: hypothetical protein GC164_13310 [Phycisphaera sp.]|nr:hypothetical protein [Phycisphaera sp.]